ncbi:ATP synthase-coupling factor 6, mitochondrial-like [Lepus europaeus]|uniref:ATP synthase-coupling factor 6, mitochondrial-like n=1 Tax=Lepus europaeus TaxID=9983 RepID=UPI002B45E20C|nr:ATP synthase-coupling factor 6, mitochondrial-like [Lepus europaeus]
MTVHRLLRFSSVVQSAVPVHLQRNIGNTAVAVEFNKELHLVQKLCMNKTREYKSKRQASGGPVGVHPECQQDLKRELFKLKQIFGKADLNTFPQI